MIQQHLARPEPSTSWCRLCVQNHPGSTRRERARRLRRPRRGRAGGGGAGRGGAGESTSLCSPGDTAQPAMLASRPTVPSRGPSHSVEEEIQPLTIRPPHLPRVSLSAQWGRRCFVHLRAGPCPSRPCAGLLGRGLHAAGGGVPTTPTGRRPPRRRLLPSSPRCSLLLPWFPHLTSGRRPGGQGPLRDVAPSRGRTPALHALRELPTARLPAPAQRLPPHLLWAGWVARARVRAPSHDGRRPELPPSRFLEPQFPIWLPLHATPSCCSWLISVQPPPASVSWAVTATHNSATAPRHDFSVHGHLHRAPSAGGSGTRGPSAARRARPARPGAAGCAGSLLASRGGASSSPGPDSAAMSSSWTQVET